MLTHNGKEYVRVSEVIGKFKDWSNVPEDRKERKRRIGTEVHQAIEDEIKGDFPLLGEETQGYYGSYLKWKESLDVRFFSTEVRYFCDEKRLTGKIDALVYPFNEFMIDLPILVDYKCTASEMKETWMMQAHLYAYLIATNGIVISPYYLFIKLDEAGGIPRVYRYEWDLNVHNKCMNAIEDFWKKNDFVMNK